MEAAAIVEIENDRKVHLIYEKDEIDKYWYNCNSDCRKGFIILILVHFCFDIETIINPIENERIINVIYLVIECISFAIIALSFKKEYGVKLSYISIIITLIRIPLRWLDFENTRK